MDQLEANLVEDAHQKLIYVVANAYRDLNEFGSIRACQAFAI